MSPARLRGARSGFLRDRSGATAVEFAMLALPFIFLMFAVFEYALAFMVSITLDNSITGAARQIRTGEAQSNSVTADTFKTMVCDNMGWLKSECTSNLDVDVRVFNTFASSDTPSPTTGGSFDKTKLKFDMGGPGDIILVTGFYKWKLLTFALQEGLSSAMYGAGYNAAVATATFRNEPYASGS